MPYLELWLSSVAEQAFVRPGRTKRPLPVLDSFVPGTLISGIDDARIGVQAPFKGNLTAYAGDYNLSFNGEVVEGLDIQGRVIFGNFTGTVRNCMIRVGAATAYGTQRTGVNAFGNPGPGFDRIIKNCEIRPSSPSVDIYGIAGWGYRLERSIIVDVVDAVNVQRSPDLLSHSAKIYSNYLSTTWYATDPRQSDGSHNDCCQIFFGSANEVIGNHLQNPDRKGQLVIFNTHATATGDTQLKNPIVRGNRLVGAYTQISAWDTTATLPGIVNENNIHVGGRGSSGTHQWDFLLTSANEAVAASYSGNVNENGVAAHKNVNG